MNPPCEFMNNPAVKAYRDEFKFCPNRGFRSDIAITVQDLDLWKIVIRDWWYVDAKGRKKKKNPLGVKAMLDDYERLVELKNAIQSKNLPDGSGQGIRERSTRMVPEVLERTNGWQG